MGMVIETDGLTKVYGNKVGCQEICLSVPEGQIFGFLGHNGAGKSTLVKMLVGLLFPTSGRASLLGRPLGDLNARRRIGFLPENFRYQEWLTGKELLNFHASLYRLTTAEKRTRIPAVLELVGLTGRENQRIKTYSKGMQQRIGIACALLPDPELLFLDEPTSALDPLGRKEVREIIVGLRHRGKTVFLNSHLLSEVEMICDQVAIIKKGRIVAAGTMDSLLGGSVEVEMEIEGMSLDIEQGLKNTARSVEVVGNRVNALVETRQDVALLADLVVRGGGRLYRLSPRQRSLEEFFVDLVREGEK